MDDIIFREKEYIVSYAYDAARIDDVLPELRTEREKTHLDVMEYAREHSAYRTWLYVKDMANFYREKKPERAAIYRWYAAHIRPCD